LKKDFRLAPQFKKRTAAKVLWTVAVGLGLFSQNVGLFGQNSIFRQKQGESRINSTDFPLSGPDNPLG
jgi:hypothetical protein